MIVYFVKAIFEVRKAPLVFSGLVIQKAHKPPQPTRLQSKVFFSYFKRL